MAEKATENSGKKEMRSKSQNPDVSLPVANLL